jgi:hypothetical protein
MIQRAASEETRGRALASAEGAKTAAFGIGVLTAGLVVGQIGPHVTYALVGVGVLLSAVPLARLVMLRAAEARGDAAGRGVGAMSPVGAAA